MNDKTAADADPGQYCPLAMSSQLLSGRWTLEILRELLIGSSSFNNIARGVPGISRTLLSSRLKHLSKAGLVLRQASGRYRLTEAGVAMGPIIRGLAEWGERWLAPETKMIGATVDFVMWDVRRHARRTATMPKRCVIRFDFDGAPSGKDRHWLVFDEQGTDLCYLDPGFDVDLYLEAAFDVFAAVWLGKCSLVAMVADERIVLHGDQALAQSAADWLGLSVRQAR